MSHENLILLTNQRQCKTLRIVLKNKRYFSTFFKKTAVAILTPEVYIDKEYHNFLKRYNINLIHFSDIKIKNYIRNSSFFATKIIKELLNEINESNNFRPFTEYNGVNLLRVIDNEVYRCYFRELLCFIEKLRSLIETENPKNLFVFGYDYKNATFRYPEGPGIKFLYSNEITFLPIIERVAKIFKAKLNIIKCKHLFFLTACLKLRAFILTTIKFSILVKRRLCLLFFNKKALFSKHTAINTKKVLVIIRGASEYFTVKPVLDRIKGSKSNIDFLIVQDDILKNPSAQKTLDKHQERYFPINSLLPLFSLVPLYLKGKLLQKNFLKLLRRFKLKKIKKNNIFETVLSDKKIVEEIFSSATSVWPEIIIFIKRMEWIFEKYRPNLIVSMSMIDRWIAVERYLADKYHIQLITIQNASIEDEFIPTPIYAHRFLAYAQKTKEMFLRIGAPKKRIIVTGSARYDKYSKKKNTENKKEKIKENLAISSNLRVVTVTTQSFNNDTERKNLNRELILSALDAIKTIPNVFLLIKLHPRDNVKEYNFLKKVSQTQQAEIKIIKDYNINDILNISDILISRTSTTILSALILGVPPIALLRSKEEEIGLEYLKTDATKKVYSTSYLKAALEEILFDPNYKHAFTSERERFIKNCIGTSDGKSTERILQIIKSI